MGRLGRLVRRGAARAWAVLPLRGVERPVFVIGCGRSGTTVFGRALGHHPDVAYLNEPRHLWRAAYPETDVWGDDAAQRGGRVAFVASDAEPARTRMLGRLFRFETLARGRSVLVEKLPINNFRLPFLRAMFPDARFVHIHRNGLEVARSIEKFSERGGWFATEEHRWNELAAYARRREETAELPALCRGPYDQGLLEWRLSTESAVAFLGGLPAESRFELSYRALTEEPVAWMDRVVDFLGLAPSEEVRRFAREGIARRSDALDGRTPSDHERRLGGPLLEASLRGEPRLCTPAR
jgi:hypothetical protein